MYLIRFWDQAQPLQLLIRWGENGLELRWENTPIRIVKRDYVMLLMANKREYPKVLIGMVEEALNFMN